MGPSRAAREQARAEQRRAYQGERHVQHPAVGQRFRGHRRRLPDVPGRPARTSGRPSTRAAWMIRALIAGETGLFGGTSAARDAVQQIPESGEDRRAATRSLWADGAERAPADRRHEPGSRRRGLCAASARLTSVAAMPAMVMPAIAPPAMSPLENSTPGPDSTSAIDSPAGALALHQPADDPADEHRGGGRDRQIDAHRDRERLEAHDLDRDGEDIRR